mgnify:CR=1 FL=1
MAKFRQIRTSFWKDAYIQDEMTAEDKFFYLYFIQWPIYIPVPQPKVPKR